MKKLVAVLGSTRPGSVSMKVALEFIKGAQEAGYEPVVFRANEMNIRGCEGCGSCRKNGTDCVINDDMQKYFREIHTCDALLVTAPNYYSQVAGPMITFMNRHYCLSNPDKSTRLEKSISFSAVYSQGAPESMPKYPPIYEWYSQTFISKGMDRHYIQIIGGDSDIEAVCQKAYNAGKNL